MHCPTLLELPLPPLGKTGWPWTASIPTLPPTMPNGAVWPRISIVTPSYNQGQFIEETIRSVLLQGYPDLEYFIMDGGSIDGSLDIIRKYAPWLTFWVSERDAGQSDAINKGWKRASGELLAWLNADDVYEPCALSRIAPPWAACPSIGLIHGWCLEFDEAGVRRTMGEPYDIVTALVSGYDRGGRVAQPAAFVSRETVSRVGMLDVHLKQSMDKDLYQRIAAFSKAVFLPETLARFRIHGQQLSQQHARDHRFLISRERLVALENLFAIGGLPSQVSKLRRKAMARTHLRLAQELRFSAAPHLAAKHLFLSVWYLPVIREWADLRILGLAVLGPRLVSFFSGVKQKGFVETKKRATVR